MSEELDEAIPDEPLEVLVDVEDTEVRDETRETSRANLGVDIYNLLNSSAVLNYNQTFVPNGSWLQPLLVLTPAVALDALQGDRARLRDGRRLNEGELVRLVGERGLGGNGGSAADAAIAPVGAPSLHRVRTPGPVSASSPPAVMQILHQGGGAGSVTSTRLKVSGIEGFSADELGPRGFG